MNDKNIGVMAAGIAYFTLLAVFPAITAVVAIALFFMTPQHIQHVMTSLDTYMPHEIVRLVGAQLRAQAGHSSSLVVAVVAVIISLFGASGAIENTMKALNVAYERRETRSWWRLKLRSMALTIGVLIQVIVVAGLLLSSHTQLEHWGVASWLAHMVSWLRWPVIIGAINITFLLLYHFGANRERTQLHIMTVGSATATAAWLLATVGIFWYAGNVANFGHTYGFLAGIIVLLIWMNISATVLLLGALIDQRRQR